MRRRRLLALAAGAALVLSPVMAGAAPLTSAQTYQPVGFFRFCAEAQLDIATINEPAMQAAGISIGGTIYESYDDFVSSKSSVSIAGQSILTVEYREYRDLARLQPKMIRCKLRTAESMTKGAWPAGSTNNGGRYSVDPYFGFGSAANGISPGTDQACTVVNQRTIDNVWANLTPAQRSAAPFSPLGGVLSTLKTLPDDVVGAGPQWTVPVAPMTVVGGVLLLKSLTLIADSNSAGVPRFEGAHYCTLVAPEYLRDVLLGTATVS